MVDPAKTPAASHEGTGPGSETDVKPDGNDAFSSAFDGFASGGNPDPSDNDDDDADDQAGHDDADDGDDKSPSNDDDQDPPEPAPGDKPAAGAKEAPDPWANASPELLAARDKLVADYENKVRGASGRASGLQRKLTELQRTIPAHQPGTPKQDDGQEKSDGEKALDDKVKKLREEYPEIAEPLIEMIEAQSAQLKALRGTVAPVISATEEELVRQQIATLEEQHPDWREFAPGKNAAFDGWKESQPEKVQALAVSDYAEDVAVALTLFKVERAAAMQAGGDNPSPKNDATDTRRKRQMDGGALVTSKKTAAATGAPDDFDGAFETFAKKATA